MDTIFEKKDMCNKIINYGGESRIYRIGENIIFKKFYESTPNETRENKLKKLEIVEKIPLPFITKPMSIVKDESEQFIGYTMSYDTDDVDMLLSPITKEEKIEILKRIKEILLELYNYGIIYGDLKEDNILINRRSNNIKLCDIDNIHINDLKMDLVPNYIYKYLNEVGVFDERTISYIHNILTLIVMSKNSTCYDELLFNIQCGTLNCDIDEKSKELAYQLVKLDKYYKNQYIIDRLK